MVSTGVVSGVIIRGGFQEVSLQEGPSINRPQSAMPTSWKHSSSRRGSTTTDTGGSGGVSAIYAAASGLHPPPSERTVRSRRALLAICAATVRARTTRSCCCWLSVRTFTWRIEGKSGCTARRPHNLIKPRDCAAMSIKLVAAAPRQVRSTDSPQVSKLKFR